MAMKRPILIHPDPRLKKVCAPVADITDDLRRLADDMLETMYDAPGIGLAAPQIGVLDRLIVMDCVKDETLPPRPVVMVNPQVVAGSDLLNTYEEGCLSIPEQYADIERPVAVKVKYLDETGKAHEIDADGFLATVIQHEIDHLDGVLFVDYLSSLRRNMLVKKAQKYIKQQQSAAG